MAAERCGDHGVEFDVVDVDAGLLQDHHVEVGVVGGFWDFGVGEERRDYLQRSRAINLFTGAVSDG